jgi:hypothetical protein
VALSTLCNHDDLERFLLLLVGGGKTVQTVRTGKSWVLYVEGEVGETKKLRN